VLEEEQQEYRRELHLNKVKEMYSSNVKNVLRCSPHSSPCKFITKINIQKTSGKRPYCSTIKKRRKSKKNTKLTTMKDKLKEVNKRLRKTDKRNRRKERKKSRRKK
jgi:hypothetical protein